MRSSTRAELAAVRRARLRISVITGAIITLLVTVVGGIAQTVMTQAQNDQVWRELRYGAARGDLSSPPGCTWLYAPGVPRLANAPGGFPVRADLDRVRATHEAVERTVRRDNTVYLVRSQVRADGDVVQAVFDMRFQLADRRYLWGALGIAEVVGLVAAAVTGAVLGRRAVAPLAEALARQRRFVTDASHELRTPVTQVYTRAQVLSRQARAENLPARHRDELARLVGSAGRLGEVLDDLLLSASLTAGHARRAERGPVDLAELARSVVAEEADRARENRLTITVDAPPHPLFVDGIESALRRAAGELLTNAIGHTPPHGRITVALAGVRGAVELTVTDTGAGFDPAETERLFERFHRSGRGGRYGLGLALLREVVTHHGGTLTATGRPGRGARFTIRLPQGTGPLARPAAQPVKSGRP
ncbi:sensor histidine kinase [Streptomyces olivaceus]|uniref:sensor histidine kinase n=1 Tax=Streptomyces olivaceus TaxID=47716 RepID=UPI0036862114